MWARLEYVDFLEAWCSGVWARFWIHFGHAQDIITTRYFALWTIAFPSYHFKSETCVSNAYQLQDTLKLEIETDTPIVLVYSITS